MNYQIKIQPAAAALLILLLSLLLTGCIPMNNSAALPDSSKNAGPHPPQKAARLSLFINLKNQEGEKRKFSIQSIEILGENNNWLTLSSTPVIADSSLITGSQIFCGRYFLNPGNYNRLRLTTVSAPGPDGGTAAAETVELKIPYPLYIGAGDSPSLFLTWDVRPASAAGSSPKKPALSLNTKFKNLLVDVAYVACPQVNTVYVICTDKNRVCDSIGVKGGPAYLEGDPLIPTANLYALTENDLDIKRIGPASGKVEETFRLSTLSRTVNFAVSPDGLWAYIPDRKRGTLLRVNLRTGSIEGKGRLGYGPSYILYLREQDVLAVSLSKSQTVVFLDPRTLTQTGAISTGSNPEGLMQLNRNVLYIAETGGNSVMVYDLARNRIKKRIPVGLSPRRILAANGRIYVANRNSNSLSVILPGQLGVSRTIRLDGSPLEMAYSRSSKWLYVGNDSRQSVDIINPVNNKPAGRISLGARPMGIKILD